MRQYLCSILVLVGCAGCGSFEQDGSHSTQNQEQNKSISEAIPPDAHQGNDYLIQPKLIQNKRLVTFQVDAKILGKDVAYLASDELKGRGLGSAGINLAADFIQTRLVEMGIEPYKGAYLDPFTAKGLPAFNVVGILPSTQDLNTEGGENAGDTPIVVIGAHYDHLGELTTQTTKANAQGQQSEAQDVIANGANDNASGVAAVLAIAEFLTQVETREKTVVLALYSAEEEGLLGSKHLAQRMQKQGQNVVAVLNFEMIGMPMQGRNFVTYATGYDMSNIAEVFNQGKPDRPAVGKLAKAAEFQLFKRSDNYPFYQAFKVPAHTFSTFDFTNFPHYHQVGDEYITLDLEHMQTVVTALLPGVLEIVNGDKLQLAPVKSDAP